MHTDEATYNLVYSGTGWTNRPKRKSVLFRYRIWLGRGLQPVCMITLNDACDIDAGNRFAIHRCVLEKIGEYGKVRSVSYFECVIKSQRFVTQVYFSKPNAPIGVPRAEMRSLAFLEKLLGLRVEVV